MAKILIKNGRVWDGERFLFADVLTDGDKISKIEPSISEKADFVYDASGKTVSAWLIDTHMHIRGISCEQFGAQAETSCFPFGVTAAADADARQGDKTLLASFMLKNAVFVGTNIKNNRADLSVAEAKLADYGDKAVGLKVYFDNTMSELSDTTPLYEICELARKKGLRVMVHCSHSPVKMSEFLGALCNGDILTHSFHGGENTAAEDGFESIRCAQSRGVIIDIGFAGNVHIDFALLKKAIDSGIVPDTIGTDLTKNSVYTRGGRYGMTLCMSIVRTLGMSEENIFKAVTSNAAKAFGKENEWGYLKVGRNADITVLDYTNEPFDLTDKAGNRLHSKTGYRCVLTVADGQVVFRD